ncbi:MAG: hypothetical protein WAN71_18925, partial [Mycobacterium sp.]|uniref:hypothetical protein n=1 Tax=Mycobacterium sp. TaxID=1785 RepID=UPI003BB1C220
PGSAARAAAATLGGRGVRAALAASESTTFVDNDFLTALDKVVVHAQNAHAVASGDTTTASRITEFTGHAISSWRHLAGLDEDNARDISPATLEAQSPT